MNSQQMGGGGGKAESSASPEKRITLEHAGYDYEAYKKGGGFLHEKVYKEVLNRAREYRRHHDIFKGGSKEGEDPFLEIQNIMHHAKIHNPLGKPLTVRNQPHVFLYRALKEVLAERPDLVKVYAKDEWKDTEEQILVEASRFLGDTDSVERLLARNSSSRKIAK